MKRRETCRLCDSRELGLVLPIRASAIADAFVAADQKDVVQDVYPLDCYLCKTCGHVQNLDIVDPEKLFRIYTYRTSSSLGSQKHFQHYAHEVVEKAQLQPGAFVVELGSNDGSLLKAFKSHGAKVLGVDPAREIAGEASAAGVPTIPEFFTAELADKIRAEHGPADVICANNVFAHVDDFIDLVQGIRDLLAPNGIFVFEASYLPDIIDKMLFDTVYHEHVSYHALMPLQPFFTRLGLQMFDLERISAKGGSFRGFVQRADTGRRPQSQRLREHLAEEERRGMTKPEIFRAFNAEIEERKRKTLEIIDSVIAKGGVVAGYGASCTTTTLTYHFELGTRLAYIVDDNPIKQDMLSPGYHLPVYSSDALYEKKPDLVVIMAWTYADPILKRHEAYVNAGGQFLIPLPEPRIVAPQFV